MDHYPAFFITQLFAMLLNNCDAIWNSVLSELQQKPGTNTF